MHVYASATGSFPITPDDNTPVLCDAIYVGVACATLAIKHSASSPTVTYKNVPAGTYLHVHLQEGRVMATGTTVLAAGDLIGMSW